MSFQQFRIYQILLPLGESGAEMGYSRGRDNRALHKLMRNDLWGGGSNDKDRVQESLDAFRKGIERVCKPVVDREFSDGYIGDP
jgi:hypothetical protein